MNIMRAKNNVENMAVKYNAAKVELNELNETDQEYRYDIHTFIKETDEQIAGMTK